MSYNIKVTARGGELTVSSTGDVPDGTHQVSGHEDAVNVNLGVVRLDTDGKPLIQVSGHHTKGA